MFAFSPFDQLDLVNDFCTNKFFEVLPEIGKKNESFFIDNFIKYAGPRDYFVSDETIKKMEDLCEKVKDLPQVKKYLTAAKDDMKRARKCHKLFEESIKNK